MSSISRRSYRGTGIPAWNWKSVIVNLGNGKGVSSTAKAVISSNADPLKLNKKKKYSTLSSQQCLSSTK